MMATYFHGGSEIQASAAAGDQNLQTLYLMNPNLITTYSEAQSCTPPAPNNMLFLNHSNSLPLPPPHQHFIGIPLQDHARPSPSPSSSSSTSLQHHHIPPTLHGLSVHPNLWTPTNNHHMLFPRPMPPTQGLSLTLSPGIQNLSGPGVIPNSNYLKAAQQLLEEVVNVATNTNCIINNNNNNNSNSNDNSSNTNNGIVNTNNFTTGDSSGAHKEKAKPDHSTSPAATTSTSIKAADPLSTAQRQELHMKKAKLLNILDEVEQRYRQYNTQMQAVVSSFEQASGSGSAKLYTSLALKTISKQFRCLKDVIISQIKTTSNTLGEEQDINGNTNAGPGVKLEGGAGSRLRFVDHQLRQQRALQHLGMMHHNAWRPQRGLPERAVSVLRAWLFEHFLHPYPKDSDKHMLAKQTGLTRSQVSNWFINARVRLWKPMVEEMYLEEIKTQEQNSGNSEDNDTSAANKNSNSSKTNMTSTTKDHGLLQGQQQQKSDESMTNDMISNISSQGFTLIGSSSDMQNSSPSSILSTDMEMKQVDHNQQRHSLLMTNNHNGDASVVTGFNPYIVNDDMAGRSFNPEQMTAQPYHGNNAVSLTLGLPHCDNLSLGNHHHNFLPNHQAAIPLGRRLDNIGATAESDFCGISMAQPSHPNNNGFESIDIQNRKRFAAQILHDFVAS